MGDKHMESLDVHRNKLMVSKKPPIKWYVQLLSIFCKALLCGRVSCKFNKLQRLGVEGVAARSKWLEKVFVVVCIGVGVGGAEGRFPITSTVLCRDLSVVDSMFSEFKLLYSFSS